MVIYVFSDEDCFPKYVGKAKDLSKRHKQHLKDRFKYDTWFYRWLNKQIKEDRQYFVYKIFFHYTKLKQSSELSKTHLLICC